MRSYLIGLIAEEWKANGIRVLIHSDLNVVVPADVCVIHIDRSVVGSRYTEFAKNYPYSVNLGITDIGKHSYSHNRVEVGDGYEGPVIVKTSLNCAGSPERDGRSLTGMQRQWNRLHRRATRLLPPWVPFQQPAITGKKHYRIFAERRLLPYGWLNRSDIIVERFRPERHEQYYVLREWYFFGDKEFYNCEVSENPVFTTGTRHLALAAPPPESIRQVRSDLRIDYGKIDYAMAPGGFAVLYDVNKTIGLSSPESLLAREVARMIAGGLKYVVESQRR